MIGSVPRKRSPRNHGRSVVACEWALVGVMAFGTQALLALTPSSKAKQPATANAEGQWTQPKAKHLVGLPDAIKGANGTLSITPAGLAFESVGQKLTIERSNILAISVGDEKQMKGGSIGRVARMGMLEPGEIAILAAGASTAFEAVPLAATFAVALVSRSEVDLVTVEFLDAQHGYHGAVFSVPRHSAERLAGAVPSTNYSPISQLPTENCSSATKPVDSVTVLPLSTDQTGVTAEYRVLIYERLIDRLREKHPSLLIVRSADANNARNCGSVKVAVVITSFRKGNHATRAMVGPAGLFVAPTALKYRVVLTDASGHASLDLEQKSSKRGDSESLDVTESIVKTVDRNLTKTLVANKRAGY